MAKLAVVKTIKARITTDAKKLWSCSTMRHTSPGQEGKLPNSSGKEILLIAPGETPSSFCNGKRAWLVVIEDQKKYGSGGAKVCEHQVDIDGE